MEKNVFNFVKAKTKVGLAEGVDQSKFAANGAVAQNPNNVKSVFESYGYDLSEAPGAFIKTYTTNPKELEEININLKEIENRGLHDIFQANLGSGIRCFKTSFIKRLVECIDENRQFLNADNTFADFLIKNEIEQRVEEISANVVPENNSEVANEIPKSIEDKMALMNPEDRQVYNEIIKDLNMLVLSDPMDEVLAMVASNAISKVIDAVLRKEYKYLDLSEMVESVMFEGLDISPVDSVRISELVSGAFGKENKDMERKAA